MNGSAENSDLGSDEEVIELDEDQYRDSKSMRLVSVNNIGVVIRESMSVWHSRRR